MPLTRFGPKGLKRVSTLPARAAPAPTSLASQAKAVASSRAQKFSMATNYGSRRLRGHVDTWVRKSSEEVFPSLGLKYTSVNHF